MLLTLRRPQSSWGSCLCCYSKIELVTAMFRVLSSSMWACKILVDCVWLLKVPKSIFLCNSEKVYLIKKYFDSKICFILRYRTQIFFNPIFFWSNIFLLIFLDLHFWTTNFVDLIFFLTKTTTNTTSTTAFMGFNPIKIFLVAKHELLVNCKDLIL